MLSPLPKKQVTWDGPDDAQNPKNWSVGRKWAVSTSLASSLALFASLSENTPDIPHRVRLCISPSGWLLHHGSRAGPHRQRIGHPTRQRRASARLVHLPLSLRHRTLCPLTVLRALGKGAGSPVRQCALRYLYRSVWLRPVAGPDHGVPVSCRARRCF